MGPTYVPRLMTTTWGRRLMGTPLLGGAVSVFAKAYAGIVSGSWAWRLKLFLNL